MSQVTHKVRSRVWHISLLTVLSFQQINTPFYILSNIAHIILSYVNSTSQLSAWDWALSKKGYGTIK